MPVSECYLSVSTPVGSHLVVRCSEHVYLGASYSNCYLTCKTCKGESWAVFVEVSPSRGSPYGWMVKSAWCLLRYYMNTWGRGCVSSRKRCKLCPATACMDQWGVSDQGNKGDYVSLRVQRQPFKNPFKCVSSRYPYTSTATAPLLSICAFMAVCQLKSRNLVVCNCMHMCLYDCMYANRLSQLCCMQGVHVCLSWLHANSGPFCAIPRVVLGRSLLFLILMGCYTPLKSEEQGGWKRRDACLIKVFCP